MTALEKLKLTHPEDINPEYTGGAFGCPYQYEELRDMKPPEYCKSYKSDEECAKCWDREIPETNLVIGDSKVEHPDTDIPAKKIIYAHIGHPDPVGEPGEPGVPSVGCAAWTGSDMDPWITTDPNKSVTSDHTMLGTENMHIKAETLPVAKILDSGNRRQFESGAVRDIQEGKGRCDLLPLDVVGTYLRTAYDNDNLTNTNHVFELLSYFQESGSMVHLYEVLLFGPFDNVFTMILEVSKHFEEGAKKYGENNWQKGIPVHCYIDSAVRHYLKFLRGDKDEPHDRAFCWNIMCAIWTCKHKPELNEYGKEH